jgi:hypothetical protein
MERIRTRAQSLPRRFVAFGFALLLLGLQATSVFASYQGSATSPAAVANSRR